MSTRSAVYLEGVGLCHVPNKHVTVLLRMGFEPLTFCSQPKTLNLLNHVQSPHTAHGYSYEKAYYKLISRVFLLAKMYLLYIYKKNYIKIF